MTITIDLPEDTLAALKADAEAQGLAEADLLRALVEKTYPRRRRIPPPGFAAHLRQEGKDGGDIVRELRQEWKERDARLGIHR